jgi:SAM-dependent methyltransferase
MQFPALKHLHDQGHEVLVHCLPQYKNLFDLISYASPVDRPEDVQPDRDLPLQLYGKFSDDFLAHCGMTPFQFIYTLHPDIFDAMNTPIVLDRIPPLDRKAYDLPDNYDLISPFGYSQTRQPTVEWMAKKASELFGGRNPIYVLSDKPVLDCPLPVLTARSLSDLPGLIAGAENFFTTNSSPAIFASIVRQSYYHLHSADIGGASDWLSPKRSVVYHEDFPRAAWKPNAFFHWYAPGGQGSGPGSSIEYTAEYRTFLESFMKEHGIRSVLDFGCGDWQFSRHVDWGDRLYYGVDIVPSLVERLRREHGSANRVFFLVDPAYPVIPNVDLIITKDVMQHIDNGSILQCAAKFATAAKHVLWINDAPCADEPPNTEITTPGYRTLDMSKPPFSIPGKVVFGFKNRPENKVVFWQEPGRAGA